MDLGWIPLGKFAPSTTRKLHPSDSTVGIRWCVYQIDRPSPLWNGSEGFTWIWSDDRSRTPNVSSPSATTSTTGKCAPDDFFVGIWRETKKKMCLSFLSTGSKGNLWILPGLEKSTQYFLTSCALTLNKCVLAARNCETTAEDWWKTCVTCPMTRVCLSTSK